MNFDFPAWHASSLVRIETALDQAIDAQAPAQLGQVMRYGVLEGGKRLRALLVLATCEAVGGDPDAALRAACAVEMIHAYSLIHDDMPCMDNDVLRRGKPTVHVAFGQAQALLAGDALQALAFEVLTPQPSSISERVQARLCHLLSRACGLAGMTGGQAIDLASVNQQLSAAQLKRMHELKTGALLKASVEMGLACAQPPLEPVTSSATQPTAHKLVAAGLSDYGAAIGLAFQIVDDILDVTANDALLGKTAGKDAAQNKPTYVTLMGLSAAQNYAQQLLDQALTALDTCGLTHDGALRALAIQLVHRRT